MAGDVLLALDDTPVRNGPDWLLSLTGRKAGNVLPIQFERHGEARRSSITLGPYPLAAPTPKKGKSPGLRFAVYRGDTTNDLRKIPEFASMKPVQEGSILKLSPDEFVRGSKDNYAVVFRGYLEFPKAGLYRVVLTSDDGSKCYLNNRLIIDNDYGHPP